MKITLMELVCQRCGHNWIPRINDVRQCPKCGSRLRDVPKRKALVCQRCGRNWIPRTNDVRQCPKCCSKFWDVPKPKVL